jgi:hypothetical protein
MKFKTSCDNYKEINKFIRPTTAHEHKKINIFPKKLKHPMSSIQRSQAYEMFNKNTISE